MHISKVTDKNDLQAILQLQKSAFNSEAVRYQDFELPPLTQTLAGIEKEWETSLFLKYEKDGKIVGSVRAYMDTEDDCCIGRLVVLPEYQQQGIGTQLLWAIEAAGHDLVAHCQGYKIFTGEKSTHVIALYSQAGYKITHTVAAGNHNIVHMRKAYTPAGTEG